MHDHKLLMTIDEAGEMYDLALEQNAQYKQK
jgi:hypothetical protein